MHLLPVADPQGWDRALLGLPHPHVLQSWAWGEFKSRHGWTVTRFLFQDEGQKPSPAAPSAAASVLQRRLPGFPASILYVPKGPALDWTDSALAESVLAELEHLARRRRALFLKLDPDLYYSAPPHLAARPSCAPEIGRLLAGRGWRFSADQVQFRNTVLLDLTPSEEDLLAAMKQKTRYNVRLAMRRDVTVTEQGGARALDTFFQLYAETARRDGFIIRHRDYYLDAWQTFLESGQAHVFLAEVTGAESRSRSGEVVAGLILFTFGSTAWYMYGASSDRHRASMPNYLLQWEAIRRAKAAGCTLYDLWGAADRLDESDPMWGVTRFKFGLGGELAEGLGAWDYPANRVGYWFYTVVMPRYLGWLRGRNQAT